MRALTAGVFQDGLEKRQELGGPEPKQDRVSDEKQYGKLIAHGAPESSGHSCALGLRCTGGPARGP